MRRPALELSIVPPSLRRLGFVLAGLLLLSRAALGLSEDEKVTEGRSHFSIARSDGAAAAQATRIVRFSPTWMSSLTLFRSDDGDALVLEERTDYAAKTMEWTVRNVKGDAWITARVHLPFSGKTQADAMAEFRDTHAQVFKLMRDDLEFETNAGSWQGSEAGWSGEARIEITKQLRQGTSFDLLEMIERNADSAFAPLVDPDGDVSPPAPIILEYLLYRPRCEGSGAKAAHFPPDCDFDQRFGFPCSMKQLSKVKNAVEAGETLDRY